MFVQRDAQSRRLSQAEPAFGIGLKWLGEQKVPVRQRPEWRIEWKLQEWRIYESSRQMRIGDDAEAIGPGVRREAHAAFGG